VVVLLLRPTAEALTTARSARRLRPRDVSLKADHIPQPNGLCPSILVRTLAAASGATHCGPPVGRIGQLTTLAIFAVRRSIRPSPSLPRSALRSLRVPDVPRSSAS